MFFKINRAVQLWRNMGTRYVLFRLYHALAVKTGWLKRKFPAQMPPTAYPSLDEWQNGAAPFFFHSKAALSVPRQPSGVLKTAAEDILNGYFTLFSDRKVYLGEEEDWLKHPETGYRYDKNQHWTSINDFSSTTGDIKFVWEKSRFSWLMTIIRYDYHFDKDSGEWVFAQIDSWLRTNPLNHGPNYKCSQEISLRCLNWIFALYYYRDHPALTDDRFRRILTAIHGQTDHVFHNIHFSRIAVRNNHAVTETMMLYLAGLLFPFLPSADRWKRHGKKWLEQEIAYQIYDDGTFLQFSHNYHRVLVQLLTWAIHLSDANGERFSEGFYQKAEKTLNYLYQCQELSNGELPNYGANDGALFFPLSDTSYRDYRPQMNALYHALTGRMLYEQGGGEDALWYGDASCLRRSVPLQQQSLFTFPNGGIYVIRDGVSLTFIKCTGYKDRPSQADNLHLDIWIDGINHLCDAGTYKYNTDEATVRYFFGTEGHNTLMLGQHDQMLKGPRFIWWNWNRSAMATLTETSEYYEFSGKITAFETLKKGGLNHSRTVRKYKGEPRWEVVDEISASVSVPMRQLWHILPGQEDKVSVLPRNGATEEMRQRWYSPRYGFKEACTVKEFSTSGNQIRTFIEVSN